MGIPFRLSTRYSAFNEKSKSHSLLFTAIFLVLRIIQILKLVILRPNTDIMQKLHVSKLNEFIEDQFHECNEVISNSFIACETKIMGP